MANDALAIQLELDMALGGVSLPAGVYQMVPGSDSPFTLSNLPNRIYRAVALTQSNFTISGNGVVFHGVNRPEVAVSDVQPVFATDKNLKVGTIKNVTFKDIAFDSANTASPANSNQRFLYGVGIDGLRFLDTIGHSSGNRSGYFAHIQNSRNIQVTGHRHDRMTGGFNLRYCENIVITDFVFNDFSEAIDLDGTSKRAVIRNGVFQGTKRKQQCIDVNDQVDASIGDFSVNNVGNIITINYKTTTPDTYSEYLANSPVRNFQIGKRIVVSNITGSQIGDGVNSPSIYIGWDWAAGNHAGSDPVSDITLENIYLEDTGFVFVREGSGLVFKNITLRSVISAPGFSAVDMRSAGASADQIGFSDLDVQIDKMRIESAQRGALKISAPSRAVVDGLITGGNNTLGGTDPDLILTSLHTRAAHCSIDNCDIEGDVLIAGDSTSVAPWKAQTLYKRNSLVINDGRFYRSTVDGMSGWSGGPSGIGTAIPDDGSESIPAWGGGGKYLVDDLCRNQDRCYVCMTAGVSGFSGGPTGTDERILDGTAVWRPINGSVVWRYLDSPYSVLWGKTNRVGGTVILEGDTQNYIHGEHADAEVGDVSAKGTVRKGVFVARRRTLITRGRFLVSLDAAPDETNYRSISLKRYRNGASINIATTDTATEGFNAFVCRDAGVRANQAGCYLDPGDIVTMDSNHKGAGLMLEGLRVILDFIEY
ncbi:hypothetical protein NKJ36_31215 [Mesorhizobium sp. M0142]|uniref:hypothetical protein n=1 Tax=unclassified Mesorhizobium TaxID=325217 RepID=UPI003337FF2C